MCKTLLVLEVSPALMSAIMDLRLRGFKVFIFFTLVELLPREETETGN